MTRKKENIDADSSTVDRRKFIAGVAIAGATAVASGETAKAAVLPQGQDAGPAPSVLRPSAQVVAAEGGMFREAGDDGAPGTVNGKPGSDFMVDVIKTLDIEFAITNPASSCRGIHEIFCQLWRQYDARAPYRDP